MDARKDLCIGNWGFMNKYWASVSIPIPTFLAFEIPLFVGFVFGFFSEQEACMAGMSAPIFLVSCQDILDICWDGSMSLTLHILKTSMPRPLAIRIRSTKSAIAWLTIRTRRSKYRTFQKFFRL